jgi:hypothetical protein
MIKFSGLKKKVIVTRRQTAARMPNVILIIKNKHGKEILYFPAYNMNWEVKLWPAIV